MSEREITHFEDVDVDKLKQSFNEWIDKFLDQFRKTLEKEMNDPQTRGRVEESEDGYLRVIGRKNDVINVGGLKVMPSEIEKRIYLQ